jgi:phosphoglucomutase
LILAIPERIRTAEHVRWAFALVRRDVEEKMRLVTANDRDKDAPALAMKARIANACSSSDGVTAGVLYNKLRPRKREEIDKIVASMVASGDLERVEVAKNGNVKACVRFRYIG